MPDMSDHELDKLFQEAAAGIKPKFEPEDWERLASRLDGGGGKTSFAREISLYSVAALLLLTSFWPGQHQPTSQQSTTSAEQAVSNAEVHSKIDETGKTAPAGTETIVAPGPIKQDAGAPGNKASSKEELQSSSSPSAARLPQDAATSEARSSNTQYDAQNTSPAHSQKPDGTKATKDNTREGKSRLKKSTTLSAGTTIDQNRNTSAASSRTAREDIATSKDKERTRKTTADPLESTSRYAETNTDRDNRTSTEPSRVAVENTTISKDSTLEIASGPVKSALLHTKKNTDQNDHVSAESRRAAFKSGAISQDDSTQEVTSGSTKDPLLFAETNAHRDNTSTKSGNTSSEKITDDNDSTREAATSGLIESKTLQAKTTTDRDSITSTGSVRAAFENSTVRSLPGKKNMDGDSSAYYAKAEQKESLTAPDSILVEADSSKVLSVALPSDSSLVQSPAEKENATRSQWFLKLPVSPDFTSIDYGKPGKAGLNIGLLVEFMPGKHFSVSTGAIWSRKLYSTKDPGTDYTWNGRTAKIDLLDGDCRVLDIPINVTYYLPVGSRTSFFASTGFSSYIMLKEKYDYTIITNNRDFHYQEDFTGKNNEWFSMLNLSIGIQHQVGERFWFQAEPFLKAPIAGVGEGKVDLVSMGAFFSLKYQFRK